MKKLTVQKVLRAAKEAKKRDGYVYITDSGGRLEVWEHSQPPSVVCSMNSVIVWTTPGDIEHNQIYWRNKNMVYTIEQLVEELNAEYL